MRALRPDDDSGGDQFTVTGERPRLSWKLASDAPADASTNSRRASTDHPLPRPRARDQSPVRRVAMGQLRSGQRVQWRVRTARPLRLGLVGLGCVRGGAARRGLDSILDLSRRVSRPRVRQATRPPARDGIRADRAACARRGSTRRRSASTRLPSTASASGRRNSRRARPRTTAPFTRRHPMSPSSLRAGVNRLEIELSDGWYRGQVGAFRMPAGWGTVLGARAELHIEHTDGTRRIIRSDETWTSRRSSTVRADLMDGQTVDFTAGEGSPAPVRRRTRSTLPRSTGRPRRPCGWSSLARRGRSARSSRACGSSISARTRRAGSA